MPPCKRTPIRCLGSRLWLPAILVASDSHPRLLPFAETYYGEILSRTGETEWLGDRGPKFRVPGLPGQAGPARQVTRVAFAPYPRCRGVSPLARAWAVSGRLYSSGGPKLIKSRVLALLPPPWRCQIP